MQKQFTDRIVLTDETADQLRRQRAKEAGGVVKPADRDGRLDFVHYENGPYRHSIDGRRILMTHEELQAGQVVSRATKAKQS
ncbi:MAG: hypothetical protein ACLPSH_03725 [Vulcanimicrobiaceae bacterium]